MVKSVKLNKASRGYMVGVEKLPVQERGWESLSTALATFDPKRHGGEAMADAPVGLEKLQGKEARQTIEDAKIIRLSVDDQQRLADLLLSPPPLAPAMKRALKARKRLISDAK